MAGFGIDPLTEEDRKDEFAPIPAGTYEAVIIESEIKATQAGTGSYLNLKHQIIDGTHSGRTIYNNINLKNPNETAVKIGRKALAQIEKALGLGVGELRDDEQMKGKPMKIKVVIGKDDPQYGARNEIKAYLPYLSDEPPAESGLGGSAPAKKAWEV